MGAALLFRPGSRYILHLVLHCSLQNTLRSLPHPQTSLYGLMAGGEIEA